eukprot:TRINITY_DN8956_c0_g1_i1.p1 TRINITY_DN8956_c0_g1~~TRINITY_DN8956_c0_g1_i1.p1  ORF type:complete len:692 (-),score=136.32 TRINITY_DN8956_c0_g1_i1:1592-3667(-)
MAGNFDYARSFAQTVAEDRNFRANGQKYVAAVKAKDRSAILAIIERATFVLEDRSGTPQSKFFTSMLIRDILRDTQNEPEFLRPLHDSKIVDIMATYAAFDKGNPDDNRGERLFPGGDKTLGSFFLRAVLELIQYLGIKFPGNPSNPAKVSKFKTVYDTLLRDRVAFPKETKFLPLNPANQPRQNAPAAAQPSQQQPPKPPGQQAQQTQQQPRAQPPGQTPGSAFAPSGNYQSFNPNQLVSEIEKIHSELKRMVANRRPDIDTYEMGMTRLSEIMRVLENKMGDVEDFSLIEKAAEYNEINVELLKVSQNWKARRVNADQYVQEVGKILKVEVPPPPQAAQPPQPPPQAQPSQPARQAQSPQPVPAAQTQSQPSQPPQQNQTIPPRPNGTSNPPQPNPNPSVAQTQELGRPREPAIQPKPSPAPSEQHLPSPIKPPEERKNEVSQSNSNSRVEPANSVQSRQDQRIEGPKPQEPANVVQSQRLDRPAEHPEERKNQISRSAIEGNRGERIPAANHESGPPMSERPVAIVPEANKINATGSQLPPARGPKPGYSASEAISIDSDLIENRPKPPVSPNRDHQVAEKLNPPTLVESDRHFPGPGSAVVHDQLGSDHKLSNSSRKVQPELKRSVVDQPTNEEDRNKLIEENKKLREEKDVLTKQIDEITKKIRSRAQEVRRGASEARDHEESCGI